MPSGADGKHYRTHGQAARYGKQDEKPVANAAGGDEVGKGEMKGSNVIAIKHSGDESGPKPPFHVKHESGEVTHHDSKEDLMAHLDQHLGGGEDELKTDDSQMDADYGSEGSAEALKSLMG